jgi:hypothetical protein
MIEQSSLSAILITSREIDQAEKGLQTRHQKQD